MNATEATTQAATVAAPGTHVASKEAAATKAASRKTSAPKARRTAKVAKKATSKKPAAKTGKNARNLEAAVPAEFPRRAAAPIASFRAPGAPCTAPGGAVDHRRGPPGHPGGHGEAGERQLLARLSENRAPYLRDRPVNIGFRAIHLLDERNGIRQLGLCDSPPRGGIVIASVGSTRTGRGHRQGQAGNPSACSRVAWSPCPAGLASWCMHATVLSSMA